MTKNDMLMEIKVREMFLEDAVQLGLQNAKFILAESIVVLKQAVAQMDQDFRGRHL